MAYSTPDDLALRVGGSAVLVRLLDKDGDGVADDALVSACINQASSEVDAAVQVRHSLPLASTPMILTATESSLAAYYAHQFGTDGQGVPPNVRQMAEDARAFLTDVAEGRRTLAVSVKPATDLEAAQVDPDPDQTSVSRTSLKGFW